jgi:hypothetical protein
MSEFISYRHFRTIEDSEELTNILDKNSIEYVIEEESASVDITFTGNLETEFHVKLHPEDFDKVNEILEKQAAETVDQIDTSHYLYQFSNEELFEILEKPDEWSEIDHLLAHKILKSRGAQITNEEVEGLKLLRNDELAQPEKASPFFVILGYAFAVAGGLIGIFIGYYIYSTHKILTDGERLPMFDESSRVKGKIIMMVGVLCFVVIGMIRLLTL